MNQISKSEMLDLIKSCLYNPIVFYDPANQESPAMMDIEDIETMNEKAENILAIIEMVFDPKWIDD
jgi:hypothetical protein